MDVSRNESIIIKAAATTQLILSEKKQVLREAIRTFIEPNLRKKF